MSRSCPEKSAACAQGFLTNLLQAAPFKITKILTDNGQEFTDRFCATGEREPTGKHGFDRICPHSTSSTASSRRAIPRPTA